MKQKKFYIFLNLSFIYYFFNFYFIFGCIGWLFVATLRLSLAVVSRGYSSSRWLLLSWSTGSRCMSSAVAVRGLSCFSACGIFLDQGSNRVPCIGRQIPIHCATREVRVFLSHVSSTGFLSLACLVRHRCAVSILGPLILLRIIFF